MITIKNIIGKKTEEDALIENYKRILKEHPDEERPDIHLKLGISYEKIGEKETAIEEYAMAAALYFHAREIYGACVCNYLITQIDPSNRDALANLALIEFQTGAKISPNDCDIFLQNLGITLNKPLHIAECQEERSQPKPQPPITEGDMEVTPTGKPRTRLALNKTTKKKQQQNAHFQMERKSLVDLIEGNAGAEEQEQHAHFQMERKSLVDLIEGNAGAEEQEQFAESVKIERKQSEEVSSQPDILIDLTRDQSPQTPETLEFEPSPQIDLTQKRANVPKEVSSAPTEDVSVNLHYMIPLFSELSQTELDHAIKKARISTYTENMCIMHGRNEQQQFFVILDGTIDLHIEFYEEEQRALTIPLKKGDFWGEHSFLRQKGVSLIALATTPCRILELPKTNLISLAQRYSGILDTLKNTCKRRCFYPTLSKSPIFLHLTTQERQDIAEYFFTMNVKKGTDIITEGKHDKGIYLIKSGEVEVRTALVEQEDSHVISTDQKQIRLATLTAGDIFGEGTFFTKEPRSATISALTYTELLKLPDQNLTQILRNYPHIGTLLKDIHQQRLINTVKILQGIL